MKQKERIIAAAAVFMLGCMIHMTAQENSHAAQSVVSRAAVSTQNTPEADQKNWRMHIKERTIVVPGLKKDYRFLFLSDTHIGLVSQADSSKIREYAAQRSMQFRNEEGIESAEQLAAWISYANREKVDAVLLGGDILDFPSQTNIDFIKEKLDQLDCPYLYVPGNHDWTFPWEYMTDYGKEHYMKMLEVLKPSGGAVYGLECEKFMILAVDDSSNQISEETLQQYSKLLQKDKPVILLTHVPLFTESLAEEAAKAWENPVVLGGEEYGGIGLNETSAEFLRVTTAEESPVTAVLTGHVHFGHRSMIEGRIPQIVAAPGYQGNAVLLHVVGL